MLLSGRALACHAQDPGFNLQDHKIKGNERRKGKEGGWASLRHCFSLLPFENRNPLQRHNPEQWGTFFSSADCSEFP